MAHKAYLLSGARQLRKLVDQDARALEEAHEAARVANERVEEMVLRSQASAQALEVLEARLYVLVPASVDGQDELFPSPQAQQAPPAPDQDPVVNVIRAFIEERSQATRSEIVDHVQQLRPSTKPGSVSAELSRLLKRGDVVRCGRGVYGSASSPSGRGDS